jgi:hypothetical protein
LVVAVAFTLSLGSGTRAQEKKEPVAVPSSKQKIEESQLSIEGVRKIYARVQKLLGTARKEKDFLKLNCLKEKATALKGLLRVCEQAFASMQEAAVAKADLLEHEFQRITLAAQRGREIGNEAEACTGEAAVYTGPVELKVDIDPSIPQRDPTVIPPPGLPSDQYPWLDRPQALSPAM